MDALNHLKELTGSGELAVIIGASLQQKNPWAVLLDCALNSIAAKENGVLKDYVNEIRERDLPPEVFFRILYQQIGTDSLNLFADFQRDAPHSLHRQLALLLKNKAISWLGTTAIDNGLDLAFQEYSCEENSDYVNAQAEEQELPIVAWLNGRHHEQRSLLQNLDQQRNRYLDFWSEQELFFPKLAKARAILVIAEMPGEFCWRALCGKLLSWGRRGIPIYWVTDKPNIAIHHISSLSTGTILEISANTLLNNFLAEAIPAEPAESTFACPQAQAWLEQYESPRCWNDITALLLNHVMSRNRAGKLFSQSLEVYQQQKKYLRVAFCYRHLGQILLEQGHMERAIENHLLAIEHWSLGGDEKSMAYEYMLCGDNYWNGGAADKALQHYGESLSYYRRNGDNYGIAEVSAKLALICDVDEDYQLALKYYLDSLLARKASNDGSGLILALLNLSNCLIKNQEWQKAETYLQEAIELAGQNHDAISQADAYQLLGLIKMNYQDYNQAKEYYEKAYQCYQQEHDLLSLTFIYCNLGHLCARLEDYSQAIKHYEDAVECYEKMGDWHHLAAVYTNLGFLHSTRGEYRLAEDYFGQAEEIFAALKDVYNLIKTHSHLAKVYAMQGEIDNAVECYNANIEMLLQLGAKEELAGTLVALAMVYLQNQDFTKATEQLQKAVDLYESLGLQQSKQETMEILTTIGTNVATNQSP